MQRRLMVTGVSLAAAMRTGMARAQPAGANMIDQFAATLNAHDINAFAALFADDYVNHQTSAAAPPPPADKTNKQATVAFFNARLTGIPDLRVEVEASVLTPEKVAGSFIYSGTHGGPYFGMAPTGKPLRFSSCDIFRISNGKIVEHWGMGDIAGVMAQLRG
jgi:steroid delta-isomerase-like uncharacterized protein